MLARHAWIGWSVLVMTMAAGVARAGDDRPVIAPDQAVGDLTIERTADGGHVVVVGEGEQQQRLDPATFIELVHQQQEADHNGGLLFVLFNISSWTGVLWVALGLGGQVLFTGRMVVQWLVSERAKRSIVPVAFWWLSLIGATMLIAYFLWRKDVVGVFGQGTGWLIYVRNLILICRGQTDDGSRMAADPMPSPVPSGTHSQA